MGCLQSGADEPVAPAELALPTEEAEAAGEGGEMGEAIGTRDVKSSEHRDEPSADARSPSGSDVCVGLEAEQLQGVQQEQMEEEEQQQEQQQQDEGRAEPMGEDGHLLLACVACGKTNSFDIAADSEWDIHPNLKVLLCKQ